MQEKELPTRSPDQGRKAGKSPDQHLQTNQGMIRAKQYSRDVQSAKVTNRWPNSANAQSYKGLFWRVASLDLADDLAGASETLYHLLAFLSSAGGVVAFLEEFV